MGPIKVGIVGYGNASRVFHIPHIRANPDFEIIAFHQRSPAPDPGNQSDKPHCTLDYPQCKHYTELDDFMRDEAIELGCDDEG